MCGRYAASADVDELVEDFEVDEVAEQPPPPSWNVAPTDPVAAVVERRDKQTGEVRRKLVQVRWGLVPSWSKNPGGGARMINARAETVAEKPAFRKAFAARRCLIPADGYYEWYAEEPPAGEGKRGFKPVKQPWFIHRTDGERLVMAGIYEFWRDDARPADDPEAWLSTCSIITTSATDSLGHLHDRMPMVIAREAWADWLDPGLTDPARAVELLAVTEAERLGAYPVSKAVGNVRNNSPELVRPLAEGAGE
ncbi:SOS response-associated peptidase [Naumannella sp. ID2617S]|nr:SOS response-associated peptidase [Naumannella sp. ID2617S]